MTNIKRNIIICTEGPRGEPPRRLRDVGIRRILFRTILKWSAFIGTYGMGGPGFFGFRLAQSEEFRDEWLILTLWGATRWLAIDGRPVETDEPRRSFWDFLRGHQKAGVAQKSEGSMIVSADITDQHSRIHIQRKDEEHLIEVLREVASGTGKVITWNQEESFLDAWVISSREKELWV